MPLCYYEKRSVNGEVCGAKFRFCSISLMDNTGMSGKESKKTCKAPSSLLHLHAGSASLVEGEKR